MQPRGSIVLSQNAQHWRHSVCWVVLARTAMRESVPRLSRFPEGRGGRRLGDQRVRTEQVIELRTERYRGAHAVPPAEAKTAVAGRGLHLQENLCISRKMLQNR